MSTTPADLLDRSQPQSRLAADGIGASLRRFEDQRFLTGHGQFVADLQIPGALHCVLVRSPHAHARIRAIGTECAKSPPGVVAVLTGADMAVDQVGPMLTLWPIRSADGRPLCE